METAIRKTFTIYNKEEKRLIRTFNYIEDAKKYLNKYCDKNCEIVDTDYILKELSSKI